MKILLTGSTGFVGWSVAERLLDAGHGVRCLVRSPARAADLHRRGAEIVQGDVARGEGVEDAVRGVDAVIHCAGVVRAWTRSAFLRTNALGTRLLAAVARDGGASRFLLVSSLAAQGPGERGGAVTEETPPRPINAYGESKLEGEHALEEAAGGMRWTVVRPCAVYGPRDRDFLALFRMVGRGWGFFAAPREARLSLIHVEDLAVLILLALEGGTARRAYLASDGEAHSWPEILGALGSAMERSVFPLRIPPALLWPIAALGLLLRPFRDRPPILCPAKLREAAEPCWVASSARAREELGWRPAVTLEEGARRTAEWYRENRWL